MMNVLFRSRDGIQYVEHAEGHGDRMFVAACDLGLEGIEEVERALSIGTIEELAENQKPQNAGSNPRGWKLLAELLR